MARRRRQEPQGLSEGVPAWLWEFDGREWGWHSKNLRSCQGRIEGHHEARLQYLRACQAWLSERGLVTQHHAVVSRQEFKRIEREEPHRILRRPDA